MEYWNKGRMGFLKGNYFILFLTPNCIILEPIIPLFQYSIIPIDAVL